MVNGRRASGSDTGKGGAAMDVVSGCGEGSEWWWLWWYGDGGTT